MSIVFDDAYDRDPFNQLTPPSLDGLHEEQEHEEGTMFTNPSHNEVNHVSAPVNGVLHSLFSQIDHSFTRPQYSDLCMAQEFTKNRGIHFEQFMKEQLIVYNVKRKDEVFFRNNAIFDDKRFYSLCDHLAVNHDVLQQVIAVFHDQGPKDLIVDTIRRRLAVKNLRISNSSKNPFDQYSVMYSTGQQMPGPSSNSRNSNAGIGESSKCNKRRASESSSEQHNHDQSQEPEENPYLRQRQQNIARNSAIMTACGIGDVMR